MKVTKRIKENITHTEYKKLMNGIRGNEAIRNNTKSNLLRTCTILYYCGLRVNELQELRIKNIRELIETGTTKILLPKTNTERKLYITNDFRKELVKLFDLETEDDLNRVITKGNSKQKRDGINTITFISMVNEHLKEILGSGYTSHSFRQGIITEMGSKGINVKLISKYIGHRNVETTLGYIKPTDEDIVNCLVR